MNKLLHTLSVTSKFAFALSRERHARREEEMTVRNLETAI